MIETKDSLEYLRSKADFEFDINFSDPPYALGSEVIIRPDGKVDYKKANDFMNKWEMPTGEYWEQWFKEAYRTLKHGGYCVMYGMDRQLLLFKYYANLAGFIEQQSLYWYFISNFPKATDLSKQIDKSNGRTQNQYKEFAKYLKEKRIEKGYTKTQIDKICDIKSSCYIWEGDKTGQIQTPTLKHYKIIKPILNLDNRFDELIERVEAEREVISTRKGLKSNDGVFNNENSGLFDKDIDITAPSTELAKKYEGYKYSISPLKQTNETIMVFQKPYKTGSCLHDTLAYENGDDTCCCGALDIDGNRVDFQSEADKKESTQKNQHEDFGTEPMTNNNCYGDFSMVEPKNYNPTGRYPSQTFCDSNTAEVLDKQSGISKGNNSKGGGTGGIWTGGNSKQVSKGYNDVAGCSKILHKCDFEDEEHDLYFYNPKVSKNERNAGCDDIQESSITEKKGNGLGRVCSICGDKQLTPCNCIDNEWVLPSNIKNNHPTLKPIKLNERILKLFKTPNEQKIIYPFAGSGSEIIGGIKAGFTNWQACELNPEYVEIAKARIKYWGDGYNE